MSMTYRNVWYRRDLPQGMALFQFQPYNAPRMLSIQTAAVWRLYVLVSRQIGTVH